jgi:hypothetical protein
LGGAPASKGAYWDAVCLPAHITTAALDGGTIGFSSKRTRIGSIILIGARLDAEPELLFGLRKVDANELIARAGQRDTPVRNLADASRILDSSKLADVFGIDFGGADPKPWPAKLGPFSRITKYALLSTKPVWVISIRCRKR